jgi:hypothetical protein
VRVSGRCDQPCHLDMKNDKEGDILEKNEYQNQ